MTLLRSLAILALFAALSPAADWPQWRGLKRDGNSAETGLLKEWPKEGPKLLWQAKGAGRGYSSIAVAAGKVYTVGDGPSTQGDKNEYLVCLNEADGKVVWQAKLGAPYTQRNDSWGSSRSTPTVDGDLVYVLTGSGDLVCLQASDGKELWRKNMQKDFGGRKSDSWGYSESALIDGNNVICSPGGKSAMVALDKKTGKLVWTATLTGNPGAGHASVVPSQVGKHRVLVQTNSGFGFGVNAETGKVLWTVPKFTTVAVIPTPIVRGEYVLIAKGYGGGGILLKQVADGDGVKVEEVYPLNSVLSNKHGGLVLVGDYVYGDVEDNGSPVCVDFLKGEEKWKKSLTRRQSISLCAAEGMLYMHSADGVMRLVKADPKECTVVSSFKLPRGDGRPDWSHPIIANGKLLVRSGDHVLCYDIKAR